MMIIIGGAVAATNWSFPILYYLGRLKGKSASSIPVVGGVLLAAGFYFSGINILAEYFWLPLFLDIGCLPMLFMFAWRLLKDAKGKGTR